MRYRSIMARRISLVLMPVFLFLSFHAATADTLGDHRTFFVNPGYDVSGRTSIATTLEYVGSRAYYYVDDTYLNSLSSVDRANVDQLLASLSNEFDNTIYPKETAIWGSEPNPGIDNDPRITVILERLNPGTGGDFDTTNEYPQSRAASSNQREILTVNVSVLGRDVLRIFLAHELQHLISFNQKVLNNNVDEDVWFNELRSQYAITAAGYNDNFATSDLLQRAQTFVRNPNDSVMEWPNVDLDYASVTLFGHYLVEQYGAGILSDTLKGPLTGIASINDWLASRGYSEKFTDVFAHWELANYLNSTAIDQRDGYTDPNLKQIRVSQTGVETLRFPNAAEFSYSIKPWQPVWYQYFVGSDMPSGKIVKLDASPAFPILYYDDRGTVQMLNGATEINHPENISWFILMPVNNIKTANFGTSEAPSALTLKFSFADQTVMTDLIGPAAPVPPIYDGTLIKAPGEADIYVVTGAYKRFLNPAVLKMYGLDPAQAVAVSPAVFNKYVTSNYIRAFGDKKVYAVWPDGTKHWLNMSAKIFSDSGRDWNSIFIVNDLERDFYKTAASITR